MADTTIHLPPDWERKEYVRKLAIRLGQSCAAAPAGMAPLFFLRMWTEWASNAGDWRPLNKHVAELSGHDWKSEDLTFIIEDACGWGPEPMMPPGRLLVCAIEAGIYEIQERGDISGISLVDWCTLNEHLMPDFVSMQSKGGKATRRATARKLASQMAEQQALLFAAQGTLLLTTQTDSADEQKAALALVIQIDRHCGHAVRCTSEYNEGVIRDAVAIIRRHPQPMIDLVLTYLHENRTNAEVVTVPNRVLEKFDDYLAKAATIQ